MQLVPKLLALILALTAAPVYGMAQTPTASTAPATTEPAKPIAFDVATVRRNKSGVGAPDIQSPRNGDSITITNMPLRMIIGFAFDLARYNSTDGLPPWANAESYDITAKVAAPDLPAFRELLPRQRNPMLQSLLADRFHLQSHFELRQLPAYVLVVANGRSKLTEVQPAISADGRKEPGGIRTSRGEITSSAAPIAVLVDALSVLLGRPVVDHTGLTGHYNFTLQFSPAQASADTQPDAGPSVFTAVQEQLGLKLESTKAPVRVLVIDHVDRPTEN